MARMRVRKGAAAVEFAIIATFVLLPLFAAVIDFGHLFWVQHHLATAAREGARVAAKTGDAALANAAVRSYLTSNSNLKAANISSATTAGMGMGNEASTTVTYSDPNMLLLPWESFIPNITRVQASVVMRSQV